MGGAVTVTVATVEARHTHSTLHMMRGGDGRLLSRVTAVDNMAAASISWYEQSRAIQISRRSMRNSRDLYRRPLLIVYLSIELLLLYELYNLVLLFMYVALYFCIGYGMYYFSNTVIGHSIFLLMYHLTLYFGVGYSMLWYVLF